MVPFNVIEEKQNCFALLVLRQFSDRIADALLINPCDKSTWEEMKMTPAVEVEVTMPSPSSPRDDEEMKEETSSPEAAATTTTTAATTSIIGDNDDKLTLIQVPTAKRGRRDTKFDLLVLRGVICWPWDLPAMARQQISWCYKLDHRILFTSMSPSANSSSNDDGGCGDDSNTSISNNNAGSQRREECFSTVSSQIYEYFSKKVFAQEVPRKEDMITQMNQLYLRIDTFPKSVAPMICKCLQRRAALAMSTSSSGHNSKESSSSAEAKIDEDDPFSGPLNLTLSASRANYIISVVEVVEGEEYVFGIDINPHSAERSAKFNNGAAGDILVEPIDYQTGLDLKALDSSAGRLAPTSRAYYKLKQVFDDYSSHPDFISFPTVGSAGVDLGSSPGGWTQVLCSEAKLSRVLSIDPGILAQRVEQLEEVTHCRHDFTSLTAQEELASFSPFSFVVCDASTNATEVFPKIICTFDKVHEKLRREEPDKMLLTCPSNVVITIKMPYKTNKSQTRILKTIRNQLPHTITSMLKWSTAKRAFYKIVHQMANSDNERTIIIQFR